MTGFKRTGKNVALAVFAGTILGYFILDSSGFCVSQGRFLTDKELLQTAFDLKNKQMSVLLNAGTTNSTEAQSVPYASYEEYLAQYPDCCTTSPPQGEFPPPSVLDILFGRATHLVRVRYVERRGAPDVIRVDNGPDYMSGQLLRWAEVRGIAIQHIRPGKPQQNAYI